jgi:hypothetical protein
MDYEGVPTEREYAEIESLRRDLASGILVLMFGESKALLARPDTHYSGRVSEEALEARMAGVDARLPWDAVTAHAASSRVILLLIGQVCLPIAKSFFPTEEPWQVAHAIISKKVPVVPTAWRPDMQWKTTILWLALLVVIFLAWHFAQTPGAK